MKGMRHKRSMNRKYIWFYLFTISSLFACSSDDVVTEQIEAQAALTKSQQTHITLRILETSDLQAKMKDFNYYTGKDDPRMGLARTASLIAIARKEHSNNVLIDNGDLLQGSPLGDYANSLSVQKNRIHPIFLAMNILNYSVGNIGHQDFMMGLPFLEWAINSANFPFINANIYCKVSLCANGTTQDENVFTPYLIKPTTLLDKQGNEQSVNIGYIGFVDPKANTWHNNQLTEDIAIKDIIISAEKWVPKMKEKGADIIIAIPHSSIAFEKGQLKFGANNAVINLADVEGIDAILFGHSHYVFPSPQYTNLWNSNIDKGTINGIPAVAPGFWGNHLGIIDLTLNRIEGKWIVIDSKSTVKPIFDNQPLVLADKRIEDALADVHKEVLKYSNQNRGITDTPLYSALSLIQDSATIQLLSDLLLHSTTSNIKNNPAFKDIPLLSAISPSKVGGDHSKKDANLFVDIKAGEITYQDIISLYPYSNTLAAVKVTGKLIKEWLECSANQFNQINPNSSAPQSLINWKHHQSYNFDIIKPIQYQIDVTQPSQYDEHCIPTSNHQKTSRISDLSYTKKDGSTLTGDAFYKSSFIVITSNYRAFSGQFPGTGPKYVIFSFPDDIQALLSNYITQKTQENGSISITPTYNWHLKPIKTKAKLNILFQTQNTPTAKEFIIKNKKIKMIQKGEDQQGYADYQLLLDQQ